jgi:hypothetical protein
MIKKDVPTYCYLPDEADAFYYDILSMKKEGFTNYGKIHLVHMCRMIADLIRLESELDQHGTIVNGRISWKVRICESLHKRILAYSRLLGVDAVSMIGRCRDNVNKNRVKRKMVEALENLDGDLMALPVIGGKN